MTKPMVYYPIQTLVNAGIQEILLVTAEKSAGDFLRLLGNAGILVETFELTYQDGEGAAKP